MEINIQEIIELEDCSKFAIEKRNEQTKHALFLYRNGKSKLDPEEKEILIAAMEIYKSQANERDAARYNALLYRNFASYPLKEGQIAKKLYINKRTVYKLLDLGTKDLTSILYGVGGLDLLPNERSLVYIKESLQEAITKQLTEGLYQEVRKEVISFFKEQQPNIIEEKDCYGNETEAMQQVREALKRFKQDNLAPGEREELMQAMERYEATVTNKKQDIAYNILFSFYFANPHLKAAQLSDKYRINKRTVYKYITRGVGDLAEIMYGTDGICLKPGDKAKQL
jgi:hypothetical protein